MWENEQESFEETEWLIRLFQMILKIIANHAFVQWNNYDFCVDTKFNDRVVFCCLGNENETC